MPPSLGERLKEVRERRNWSLEDLAAHLEVSKSCAGHYEQNLRYPRAAVLRRIAKLLKTPLGELYEETAGRGA